MVGGVWATAERRTPEWATSRGGDPSRPLSDASASTLLILMPFEFYYLRLGSVVCLYCNTDPVLLNNVPASKNSVEVYRCLASDKEVSTVHRFAYNFCGLYLFM